MKRNRLALFGTKYRLKKAIIVQSAILWTSSIYISLILCLLASCQKEKAEVSQEKEEDGSSTYTGPLLAFQNIETVYSQMGEAKLVLRAPLQYREQNGDERFPEGVEIDIYDKGGQKKTLILADSARYINEQRLYVMMGDVSVTNLIEQQRLQTPILFWDERYQEIYTDTVVTVTTQREVLNGIGLRAKQDFSQYKILDPKGIIRSAQ